MEALVLDFIRCIISVIVVHFVVIIISKGLTRINL